jgi:hypothetical protein
MTPTDVPDGLSQRLITTDVRLANIPFLFLKKPTLIAHHIPQPLDIVTDTLVTFYDMQGDAGDLSFHGSS